MKNVSLRIMGRPVGHNNTKNYEFVTSRPPRIAITGGSGDIRVTTHDGPHIRVTLSWFGINTEWIGDTIDVKFDDAASELTIDTEAHDHFPPSDFAPTGPVFGVVRKPKTAGKGGTFMFATSVDVEISVPQGSDVVSVTRSGDVTVSGSFRNAEITTSSGDIHCESSDGILLETALLSSNSGDISCRGVLGSLTATTNSGDVWAERTTSAEITTTSGDIQIGVAKGAAPGRFACTAKSGDVVVRVAPGLTVDLDLGTKRGDISNGISMDGESSGETDGSPADARIVIRTSSGDVRIKKSLL